MRKSPGCDASLLWPQLLSFRDGVVAALCLFLAILQPTNSSAQDASEASVLAISFEMGSRLGQAAMLALAGAPEGLVEDHLTIAKACARVVGIRLPDLPKLIGDPETDELTTAQFVVGTGVESQLRQRFGRNPALAFEVATKTNLLLVFYSPSDDLGLTSLVAEGMVSLGLPHTLWEAIPAADKAGASEREMRNLVLNMLVQVAAHLHAQT